MVRKRSSKPRWGARRSTRSARGLSVLHSCGHTQAHRITGPVWKKEREKVRLGGRPCTACWQKAQAEEMELLCGIKDLPALDGTDAQVLWARSIRGIQLGYLQADAARLDRIRRSKNLAPVSEEILALALPPALKKIKAKFWIDHREEKDLLYGLLGKKASRKLEAIREETGQAEFVPASPFQGDSTCPF